jgi:hypothetical protein
VPFRRASAPRRVGQWRRSHRTRVLAAQMGWPTWVVGAAVELEESLRVARAISSKARCLASSVTGNLKDRELRCTAQ